MSESSKEPVIGRRVGVSFSKLPEVVPAPQPFEKTQIGVHRTIGGESVIDTTHNSMPHPREAMKGEQDIGKIIGLLEPLIPEPNRLKIQNLASELVEHPEEHRDPMTEIRTTFEDPTDREYAAAILARYQTTRESANSGNWQSPNREAYGRFEENKRQIFQVQKPHHA